MAVRVTTCSLLKHLSKIGQDVEAAVDQSDAVECLRVMTERFPSLREWVYERDGSLRRQIRFYVNGELLPDNSARRQLRDGDELLIFFYHM